MHVLSRLIVAGLALAGCCGPVAAGEYRLQSGDTLEVTVAGVPDMRSTLRVDADGEISVPLVGDIKVAGKTLTEVRTVIRTSLSGKFLRLLNQTGVEYQVTFEPEKISISIGAYRPVYVMGDVGRAGEIVFRPGLTAQQAVALAGGYDIARQRTGDPVIQSADLRTEYENLWIQVAREQARIARLRSELQMPPSISGPQGEAPVPTPYLNEIRANEDKTMDMRRGDRDRELAFIDKSMAQAAETYGTLNEQRAKEEEGVRNDAAELSRLQDMEQRGTTTTARVMEARRSLLLSSTRLLQTVAQATALRRDQTELERRKTRYDDTRTQETLRDLQDAEVRLAMLTTQVQSAGDKLLHVTALRSTLARGGDRKPTITITRTTGEETTRFAATEDTLLEAGDTIDVALTLPTIAGQ